MAKRVARIGSVVLVLALCLVSCLPQRIEVSTRGDLCHTGVECYDPAPHCVFERSAGATVGTCQPKRPSKPFSPNSPNRGGREGSPSSLGSTSSRSEDQGAIAPLDLEVYCPNIGMLLEGTYCGAPFHSNAPWGEDGVSCGDIVVACQPAGTHVLFFPRSVGIPSF